MSPRTVIRHYGGNKTLAAKELGISRRTLYNWIKLGVVPQMKRAYVAQRMREYRSDK